MKLYLLIQASLLLLSGQCFSQTDSFDVFTYRSPEFFTKSELPSRLQFTMSNADGNFCTITLYKSQYTKEDVMKNVPSVQVDVEGNKKRYKLLEYLIELLLPVI